MKKIVLSALVLLLLGTVPAAAAAVETQSSDTLYDAVTFRLAEEGYDLLSLVVIGSDEAWVLLEDSRTGEFTAGLIDLSGYQATSGSLQGNPPKGNPPGGKGNPGGPNPNGGNPGGGNPPGGKGNPGGPNPNGGNPGGGNPPGGNPGN
jgi:hypothetical protein